MALLIATIIPNNYSMPFEAVKCFLQIATQYPITYSQGPYLYDNRNRIIQFAKKHNDSLLMIDSDIVFTLEDVKKIENHLIDKDAVTGIYCLGVKPYPPAILERKGKDYEFIKPPTELSVIGACGGGFLGLSSSLIQSLPDNACDNVFEGKVMHGEDISLCHRINENHKLYCDPDIKVGHIRSNVIYYEK